MTLPSIGGISPWESRCIQHRSFGEGWVCARGSFGWVRMCLLGSGWGGSANLRFEDGDLGKGRSCRRMEVIGGLNHYGSLARDGVRARKV